LRQCVALRATLAIERTRVFKTKTFDRWARKVDGDKLLSITAPEIEADLYEADLGHGLCKKSIATPGHGKRGAVRTLVAKRHSSAVIFLPQRSGIRSKIICRDLPSPKPSPVGTITNRSGK